MGTKTYQDIRNSFLRTPLPTPLCSAHRAVGRWPLQCNGLLYLHPAAGAVHRDRRDLGTRDSRDSHAICRVRCVLSPSRAYARMSQHFWRTSTCPGVPWERLEGPCSVIEGLYAMMRPADDVEHTLSVCRHARKRQNLLAKIHGEVEMLKSQSWRFWDWMSISSEEIRVYIQEFACLSHSEMQ